MFDYTATIRVSNPTEATAAAERTEGERTDESNAVVGGAAAAVGGCSTVPLEDLLNVMRNGHNNATAMLYVGFEE